MQEREPRTKLIMKKRTALMMELSPQDALAHFAEKNGTVAAARIAASSVLNKLTASLPMRPCRSSEAPRMLSKNIPAAAAPRQFGTCCHGSNPTAADIPAITAADKTPDTVPIMLTAPLVPAGTDSQVVIRRGWRFAACPSSLDTVSAPASAKAATIATKKRELRCDKEYRIAQAAATPRLALTCDALRPSGRSAIPRVCFLRYPYLVAIHVRAKTAMRPTNAPNPTDAIRAKQMTAPATAPDRLTPRIKRAKAVKTTVVIAAVQRELLPIMPAKVITAVSRWFAIPNYWTTRCSMFLVRIPGIRL